MLFLRLLSKARVKSRHDDSAPLKAPRKLGARSLRKGDKRAGWPPVGKGAESRPPNRRFSAAFHRCGGFSG